MSTLPEAHVGPAERLLDLVLQSSAHLWHNRPGLDAGGVWMPRKGAARSRGRARDGSPVAPGLFVPAASLLYGKLLDIYLLNATLMAHFASYVLEKTEWRDLKVACAALMLVQPRAGQPIKGDDGKVEFHEDDYRAIGEAMVLRYEKQSTRMLTPRGILRIAELLETPAIAELNRIAGFADPTSSSPPLGRWTKAATRWLMVREENPAMLEGLVRAGFKSTLKQLARKVGYKPATQRFFELLGWKQKQSDGGHRTVGLVTLKVEKKKRFNDLSEAEICEAIVEQRLSYKETIGRLPKGMGLTPAIMAALLPTLSDRELRILTPTLEELGLMTDRDVQARWQQALARTTDQRGLHIAKNVRSRELKEQLEASADVAAQRAREESDGGDVHVIFLVDKSGSMEGAIELSKEALTRILAGFDPARVHIASFDTMGMVLRPKAPTRAAVEHMLRGITASGGTIHYTGLMALHSAGVRIPVGAPLLLVVVGDEAGESGQTLANSLRQLDYAPSAIALFLSVRHERGSTVRDCARALGVGFSEVDVRSFDDPYQVPRVLKTLLEAPAPRGVPSTGWVDKVMSVPLLTLG